jgi:hypothetical protein
MEEKSRQKNAESKHGTYILHLTKTTKKISGNFINVIRTVEETFKIQKTDPDIRPVYHKTDNGAKAHLHQTILACWVVSCSRYQLKKKTASIANEEKSYEYSPLTRSSAREYNKPMMSG